MKKMIIILIVMLFVMAPFYWYYHNERVLIYVKTHNLMFGTSIWGWQEFRILKIQSGIIKVRKAGTLNDPLWVNQNHPDILWKIGRK